jgi:hypothetical protein
MRSGPAGTILCEIWPRASQMSVECNFPLQAPAARRPAPDRTTIATDPAAAAATPYSSSQNCPESAMSAALPNGTKAAVEWAGVGDGSAASGRRLAALAARASVEDSRSLELGGVVWLEHVNIVVGERAVAEAFYFGVLGLTLDANGRDANIGQQQFHINNGAVTGEKPQAVAGCIGLSLPHLDGLRARCQAAPALLKTGTLFQWADHGDFVAARCPWGNTFLVWDCAAEASLVVPSLGEGAPKMVQLHHGIDAGMAVRGTGPFSGGGGAGIRFVHFKSRHAPKIAKFYQSLFGSPVRPAACRRHTSPLSSALLLHPMSPMSWCMGGSWSYE